MNSNGEDLTARITKMIADATQQERDALTDSAWAHYCEWLAEQRSAAANDLTAQLAKVMYEADAEYMNAVQGWSLMGWNRASELNRKTSAIAATAALAHLQSTGRLIPAGGMALTAEQVEDVEALVATANPYSAPAARLRALFPATEPAEKAAREGDCALPPTHDGPCAPTPAEPAEVSGNLSEIPNSSPAPAVPAEGVKPVKFRKMTPKYATANFGFPDVTVDPLTPFTRWAYKDSDGDKWVWNGDQWELHIVPPAPAEPAEQPAREGDCALLATHDGPCMPAPAEPAEEETKAEDYCCHPMCRHTNWGGSNRKHTRGSDCPIVPKPTSSPVVPAPTETGPWQNVDAIQVGVPFEDKEGSQLVKLADGKFGYLSYPRETPETLAKYAPFVAAAEEG